MDNIISYDVTRTSHYPYLRVTRTSHYGSCTMSGTGYTRLTGMNSALGPSAPPAIEASTQARIIARVPVVDTTDPLSAAMVAEVLCNLSAAPP